MSTAGIIAVNQLPLADAMKVFGRCCGSSSWAMQMARGRPYQDLQEVLRFADLKFRSLTQTDWLEAFRHVPDISEIVDWQKLERVTAAQDPSRDLDQILDRLDRRLLRYHRKFGYKFIPLDDDLSLETLIDATTTRLRNQPQLEMEVVSNHCRTLALDQLRELMTNYRPQAGDGATVNSAVRGESLGESVESEEMRSESAFRPQMEKKIAD